MRNILYKNKINLLIKKIYLVLNVFFLVLFSIEVSSLDFNCDENSFMPPYNPDRDNIRVYDEQNSFFTGYRESSSHNLNQEYAENLTLVRQAFIKKSLLTSFNRPTSSKEEILSIINFFGSKVFRKKNQFETESEYFLETKKHYLGLARDQIVLELKPGNESSSLFSNEPRLFYQLEENRIGSSVEKRKGLHIAMFPSYGSYRFPVHSTGFGQNKVEFSISPIILSEDFYWAFLNGCDGKSYTDSLYEKENPWDKMQICFS